MSKIGCSIIQDLLPVYVCEEASEDTKQLVEEHLKECKNCREEMEALRKPIVVPPETEKTIISNIKKKRRRKRIRNLICFILILSCICAASYFVYEDVYKDETMELDASDLKVSTDTDGNVILIPSKRAENLLLHRIYTQDENGDTTVYLSLKKVSDVLLFIDAPISWFMEYSVEQQVPLDVYKLLQGEDGSINLEFASSPNAGSEKVSVLYGDVIVLGDSVTTVYYQPGIEYETDAFYNYMEELYKKAINSTDDITTAEKMIYSQYEVPKSSERVLIYSK